MPDTIKTLRARRRAEDAAKAGSPLVARILMSLHDEPQAWERESFLARHRPSGITLRYGYTIYPGSDIRIEAERYDGTVAAWAPCATDSTAIHDALKAAFDLRRDLAELDLLALFGARKLPGAVSRAIASKAR